MWGGCTAALPRGCIFIDMKKSFALLVVLAAMASSCTSVFWAKNQVIPANKVLNTREIQVELFDAVGQRCTSAEVKITTTDRGDSAVITRFDVPKFSSEGQRPTKVNYLWMVDGSDTSVYELTYRRRRSIASFTTVGALTALSAIPVQIAVQDAWTAVTVFLVGAGVLTYGGLLVDLPTGLVSLVAQINAEGHDLNRSWKLKGVRTLSPDAYPESLLRGISALAPGGAQNQSSAPSSARKRIE